MKNITISKVFVPWRGVSCFASRAWICCVVAVFVPWRGVSCFKVFKREIISLFCVFVPWRGVSCFFYVLVEPPQASGFRPLAGCKLFPAHYQLW